MSKYQPRIFINNPEKNVPTNLIEQFYVRYATNLYHDQFKFPYF